MAKAQIGLIGLGVMGANLALNIERNGYPISVFNRTAKKTDDFVNGPAKGKKVFGFKDIEEFVKSIERPRRIILLVKAGAPVDATIAEIKPYLEKGDIVIDAGNSFFEDTIRRENELSKDGIFMIGSGVSGGEEGALWGPSLMPGGNKDAYEKLRPVWEAAAAKVDDGPCVTYLGPDGAGHFVKMVHNGIEYGDMQLIAEIYDIMRKGLGYEPRKISEVFEKWNEGILDSFLIEITAKILTVDDPETGKPLIDMILDKAGQKGTGKWTAESALELAVPTPTIDAALTARLMSALKDERVEASAKLSGPHQTRFSGDEKELLSDMHDALYASKICSYAQGMSLIRAGSHKYSWNVDLAESARIWKGGCIIRAQLLSRICEAFKKQPDMKNLLLDKEFATFIENAQSRWREVVATAHKLGIPVPAMGASLSYFDSYRTASLPQNLTQAQRDFFGAHTYQRADRPEDGFVHTEWETLVKEKTGGKA